MRYTACIMKSSNIFKLPESFLNQLNEFTNGYYLVTINNQNNLETYFEFPSELAELGIIQHLTIESANFQSYLKGDLEISTELIDEDDNEEDDLDGAED